MQKFKTCLKLFLVMFKIGLFTFGGGYAMISLLESELVAKRKWLESDEFLNVVAIAESTPGPVAINAATYVGYKLAGVWGSLSATVAVALPSFSIIFLISLFFDAFLSLKYVAYAFDGIQVCVIFRHPGVRHLPHFERGREDALKARKDGLEHRCNEPRHRRHDRAERAFHRLFFGVVYPHHGGARAPTVSFLLFPRPTQRKIGKNAR